MTQSTIQFPAGRAAQPPAGVLLQMHSRPATAERSLRCVSSGYLGDGCSCPATIPTRVVAAAWERQRSRGDAPQEGLFRFAWQGEMWLAFGQSGEIRGVYCPVHLLEREERLGLGAVA
jgi:hypothetical protein